MSRSALAKDPSHVAKICMFVGLLGVIGSWVTTDRLITAGAFEDNSLWVWIVGSLVMNPLCWVGFYGIYRWRRI